MDRQLIKSLIDALEASGLSELEYTGAGGETLRLVKGGDGAPGPSRPAVPVPAAAIPAPAVAAAPPPPPTGPVQGATVASPLFGVVHLQPAPGAAPFAAVGQTVDANQVLCTVEAMKVFTEVRATTAGTVDAVLVDDGQEVEPGQPLVRLA